MATRKISTQLPQDIKLLLIFILIHARFSSQTLLSVSRRIDGDILKVSSPLICSKTICDQFDADLVSKSIQLSKSCTCQCKRRKIILSDPMITFYEKTSKCHQDKYIIADNGCNLKARDNTKTYSTLIPLNVSMTSPMVLTLENPSRIQQNIILLKNIKLSKWSYYKDNVWHDGTEDIFKVTFSSSLLLGKTGTLEISNKIPKHLSGLLLKVSVMFAFADGLNPLHCIMFKVLGGYKVVLPTSAPTTVIPTTAAVQTTTSPTTISSGAQTNEVTNPGKPNPVTEVVKTTSSPTVPKKPNNNASSGKKERLLIAVATGSVTLLIVLLVVFICGCFYVKRQRRRKEKKADIIQACTRPSLPRPAMEPTSPPHDYEYVVYPALTNSLPPPNATNSLDNAMYGRGPDNELIIRTPAVSMESLISKHTNSTKSNHSTLPQQHNYTPLEAATANGSDSIYQPLIRPHTPQESVKNESKKADNYLCTSNVDEKNNDEDFSYEVQPLNDDCEKGDEGIDVLQRPRTYLEPCNDEVPEYMELEAMDAPYSTTV